jgi:hypothetical protein
MTREVSSISRIGTTEPFELQVARGQVAYHIPQFKFGFNPDVDDSEETVWAQGGLYSYLSSASVLKVSSSSTADTSAGTGARTVQLYGLDANYNEINETVTLNGQAAVNTTNSFLRINRMSILTAGTGGQNAGVVYAGTGTVTSGVPANKYATIAVGDNQTLMALWTVPAEHTAYLLQKDLTVATAQNNKYATVRLVARPNGKVFQIRDKHVLDNNVLHQKYDIPLKFEEKTDLEVRCVGDSAGANIAVSAALDIVYIKNGSTF